MCIYCTTNDYRSIYKNHIGPIPIDKNGRTYEIHHIDGNRKNNSVENLQCVSIDEHYDIHLKQQNWLACHQIAIRMNMDPSTISQMAKNAAQQRVQAGTHHFQSDKMRRQVSEKNKELSKLGLSPFQDPILIESNRKKASDRNKKQIIAGCHPWQTEKYRKYQSEKQKLLAENGLLLFQDENFKKENGKRSREFNLARSLEGTHPFQNEELMQKNRLAAKTRMSSPENPAFKPENRQKAKDRLALPVQCPHCSKQGNAIAMHRWHFDKCKSRNL